MLDARLGQGRIKDAQVLLTIIGLPNPDPAWVHTLEALIKVLIVLAGEAWIHQTERKFHLGVDTAVEIIFKPVDDALNGIRQNVAKFLWMWTVFNPLPLGF